MDYKQYCEDLEYLLLLAVQKKEISSFEMDIFAMWSDPISYQVGSTHERHLYDAYQRVTDSQHLLVKKFIEHLDRKYGELQRETRTP